MFKLVFNTQNERFKSTFDQSSLSKFKKRRKFRLLLPLHQSEDALPPDRPASPRQGAEKDNFLYVYQGEEASNRTGSDTESGILIDPRRGNLDVLPVVMSAEYAVAMLEASHISIPVPELLRGLAAHLIAAAVLKSVHDGETVMVLHAPAAVAQGISKQAGPQGLHVVFTTDLADDLDEMVPDSWIKLPRNASQDKVDDVLQCVDLAASKSLTESLRVCPTRWEVLQIVAETFAAQRRGDLQISSSDDALIASRGREIGLDSPVAKKEKIDGKKRGALSGSG